MINRSRSSNTFMSGLTVHFSSYRASEACGRRSPGGPDVDTLQPLEDAKLRRLAGAILDGGPDVDTLQPLEGPRSADRALPNVLKLTILFLLHQFGYKAEKLPNRAGISR